MRSAAMTLAALVLGGCAEMDVHAVPGMPGITVRTVSEPAPEPNTYTNNLGHMVTIYYGDGRMQAVVPGDTVGLFVGVTHTIQIDNPRKLRRKNA